MVNRSLEGTNLVNLRSPTGLSACADDDCATNAEHVEPRAQPDTSTDVSAGDISDHVRIRTDIHKEK